MARLDRFSDEGSEGSGVNHNNDERRGGGRHSK
jgi:hypothetical protein